MPDAFELGYVTVCTVLEDTPEDELEELIRSAESVQQPDFLPNKDVYVVEGEFDEYTILYSDGEPETPSEPMIRSVLYSNIFNDDVFHVHSYFMADVFESGFEKHVEMLTQANEVEVSVLSLTYTSTQALSDVLKSTGLVDFNGKGESVGAIEFERGDWEITISKLPVETSISMGYYNIGEEIPVEGVEEFIYDRISSSEECIEEVME